MFDLWDRINTDILTQSLVFLGLAGLVIILLLVVRIILYNRLHVLANRTVTEWDNIFIHASRLPSLLWCLWLGIVAGLAVIDLPASWSWLTDKLVPIIFVLLAGYTIIVIGIIALKCYIALVTTKTKSNLDDALMAALKVSFPVIISFLSIVLILNIVGIDIGAVNSWLAEHGAKVTSILIVSIAALLFITSLIPRVVNSSVARLKTEETEEEQKKRSETLVSVLTTSTQILIIVFTVLMILSEMNIDIIAVLAGLSIVGVALGFGAQSLVKDIIGGLFIIFENQFRTGDVVKIADISGLVESINLRRTVLRDLDGIVHVVPNGEIRVASNFTKTWSRVNLNISVSYGTDLDHAIAVINLVGKELAEDPKWSPAILTAPKVLRIDNFGESGIDIKILGETKPIRQWDVMGELRLRLKKAFDKEGIEIPWPHIKVYLGELPPGFKAEIGKDVTTN